MGIKMTVLCDVCGVQKKKYKCPTCQIFYCSLVCFKTHKESQTGGCINPVSLEPQSKNEDYFPDDETFLFQTPETVPLETLQLLAQSDKMKSLLANPHLRIPDHTGFK